MTETRDPGLAGRRRADAIGVDSVLPGEAATLRAAQASLSGESRGMRGLWPFLGPAFIAAVAYIDPGNFATNMAAGAKYGGMQVSEAQRLRELESENAKLKRPQADSGR